MITMIINNTIVIMITMIINNTIVIMITMINILHILIQYLYVCTYLIWRISCSQIETVWKQRQKQKKRKKRQSRYDDYYYYYYYYYHCQDYFHYYYFFSVHILFDLMTHPHIEYSPIMTPRKTPVCYFLRILRRLQQQRRYRLFYFSHQKKNDQSRSYYGTREVPVRPLWGKKVFIIFILSK